MDGLYVFNNPWAIQAMEKHTSYCAMMRLGMPIPDTWIVPPKAYEPKPDLEITLSRYARLFDLDEVGRSVGFPLFAKPYDGGGWAGVSRVDDEAALRRAYDDSGTYLLHLQRAVEPHDLFVRCIGFGPQTRLVHSAGVAKISIAGRLPTTSEKSESCIEEGGWRVSIFDRSPPTSVFVGVRMRGALSPTSGTGPSFFTVRAGPAALAATRRLSSRATPMTSYRPGFGKSTSDT